MTDLLFFFLNFVKPFNNSYLGNNRKINAKIFTNLHLDILSKKFN